jgi:hypothetical protein
MDSRRIRGNVAFECKNSKIGRRTTIASIGLLKIFITMVRIESFQITYWFLNSSRGGSTGFDANARSGRNEVKRDPKAAASVGSESFKIS